MSQKPSLSNNDNNFIENNNTPKSSTSLLADNNSNILNRILNVVKIRYDVESVQQKQLEMEKIIMDTILQINNDGNNCQGMSKESEDFYSNMIPIMKLYIYEKNYWKNPIDYMSLTNLDAFK